MLQNGMKASHFLAAQRNVIESRLSHAVTINTHLNTPVYCLRFDCTGRYFVTGADDYLVRVFCLGAAKSCRTRNGRDGNRLLRCNYGANFRGAVLVCTLRGHAGVINDIDVSSDNSFLATASTDGDVRIWGLTDGCPVAILRGHRNGANMVSWSSLTPYRLITTGSDGFARVWDIRKACLKRYGKLVGRREEYKLDLTDDEETTRQSLDNHQEDDIDSARVDLLPPLPRRLENPTENGSGDATAALSANHTGSAADNTALALPLRDSGVQLEELHRNDPSNQSGEQPDEIGQGEFVANDLLDEGVQLIGKYQHGNSHETEQHRPGTRSRRAAVNVICVSRCPVGSCFATGSDDGVVRVWEDFDDSAVAVVDGRLSGVSSAARPHHSLSSRSGIEHKPLLKLTGHVSTVTDLSYSHDGKKVLSASQKDGVVRIWSVPDAIFANSGENTVGQMVIKLIDPSSNRPVHSSRRRPGNSTAGSVSKVSCDVAVWTHDDSTVVTSQSILLKQNGTEIKPGSQYICLWSSRTGICLMGISGAHTMPCNVVIPHPLDASLICTASADGFAKIWDLGQGRCIFSHQNKLEFGPVDANSVGGSYLDGAFSPDGTAVVLTDDSGQVSVFDSIARQENPCNNGNPLFWMREQYFSNDYYDLFYDTNGYCIEKGSKLPPHVAPKSRITHKGSSFPGAEEITETFRRLVGPLPLSEDDCRWRRQNIRSRRAEIKSPNVGFSSTRIRNIVRELDPLSTLIIKGVGHVDVDANAVRKPVSGRTLLPTNVENSRTNESARYNYLGYEDLLMREAEDDIPESDDEEFEPFTTSRDRRLTANLDDSEEDDSVDDRSLDSREQNRPRRRRSSRRFHTIDQSAERRVRAQRRAQRRTNLSSDFMEIGSDDDMIAQFVSVNKTPSGAYLRDFSREGHLWRLKSPSDAKRVRRKWVSRVESDLSYSGKKFYTPQCGDSVVYIPRAHYETIKEFPSLSPPWQDWTTDTAWPIVRCTVQNIRFRFPYEDYFRRRNLLCRSIVAIVTLQVTGIPESVTDTEFPWPTPSFVEPSTSGVFEVSIFENPHADFLIPEFLYSARIDSLQKHVAEREMRSSGIPVDVFYADEDPRREDAEMEPWASTIDGIAPPETHSDVHLNDSGFSVISVTGDNDDNFVDTASPWDLNTEGVMLSRPHLTDDETKSILEALDSLLQKPDISNHFSMPVDQERYYDYEVMIEVPMDLMSVKRRLNNDYYGSKLSVVADLRLIRDNCIKYNTSENEISQTAIAMCEDFEAMVLTPEERSQLLTEEQFEQLQRDQLDGRQSSNLRIRLSARTIHRDRQAAAEASSSAPSSSGVGRYSLRDRSGNRPQSSLEALPAPPDASGTISVGRTSRWDRETDSTHEAGETRGGRYRLRGRGATNRTETLARLGAPGPESRAERAARRSGTASLTRNFHAWASTNGESNEAEADCDEHISSRRVSRRSSRSRAGQPPDYHEINSEDEDVENFRGAARSETMQVRGRSTSRPTRGSSRARATQLLETNGGSETEREDEESGHEVQDNHGTDASESGSESDNEAFESRNRTRAISSPLPDRSTRRASLEAKNDESLGQRERRKAAPRQTYMDVETSDMEDYVEDSSYGESDCNEEKNRAGKSGERIQESDMSFESDLENSQGSRNRKKRGLASLLATQVHIKHVTKSLSTGSSLADMRPAKRTSSGRSTQHQLPELVSWPDIDMGNITRVTDEILRRVSARDEQTFFSLPVAEAHPDVADAYATMISEPIDLRTMAEERMHAYTSIKMLQDDLILMYRNCCTFNEPGSVYWEYARKRWEELNDLFKDVCNEVEVLLPRRWKA
ncbi:MAG: hypothetical protein SGILL_001701 [Bacillariaceae sp.]